MNSLIRTGVLGGGMVEDSGLLAAFLCTTADLKFWYRV